MGLQETATIFGMILVIVVKYVGRKVKENPATTGCIRGVRNVQRLDLTSNKGLASKSEAAIRATLEAAFPDYYGG